jgi:hypothetical protein
LARKGLDPSTSEIELKEPVGLINFNIIPVDDNGDIVTDGAFMEEGFIVYVHNYTGFFRKSIEDIVHKGRTPVSVRVWRILDNCTRDWMEQEYVIIVVSRNYFGSKLIWVKPSKPVMNIDLRVYVRRKEELLEKAPEPFLIPLVKILETPSIVYDSVVEEEVIRIRTYLAILEDDRNRGLISEKAYLGLRKRLESMLYEILEEAEEYSKGQESIIISKQVVEPSLTQ